MATTLIIGAICGIVVGILSGLFGIGGGIVMIPLMRLGFGMEGLTTTGTSLFVILPTSISSMISRMRKGKLNLKLGVCVGVGGMCFSPLGSMLADSAGGTASMLAAAVVIAYTGINMFRNAFKLEKPVASGDAGTEGVAADGASASNVDDSENFVDPLELEMSRKHVAQAIATGAAAGFLSGFIGVGGGFLIIPMVMWLFGFSMKSASGISVIALSIIAVPSVITHALLGNIMYLRGLAIAVGSIPGSFIGTAILQHVREKPLRIVFGLLIFVMAGVLAINEFI